MAGLGAMKVLLVEDDRALGEQVVGTLEGEGYSVQWIQDGDEAKRAPVDEMALVVLDLMLPGTYGMDLLKLYRGFSDVPVLILSARQDTADKVRALKLGADDYLTKPFWPEELIARVAARVRRPKMERQDSLSRVGAIVVDPETREVLANESPVELTKTEYELLMTLMRRPGSAMTRAALAAAALGEGSERALDVHVSRLRKKLGAAGEQVQTVWGIGYKVVESPA